MLGNLLWFCHGKRKKTIMFFLCFYLCHNSIFIFVESLHEKIWRLENLYEGPLGQGSVVACKPNDPGIMAMFFFLFFFKLFLSLFSPVCFCLVNNNAMFFKYAKVFWQRNWAVSIFIHLKCAFSSFRKHQSRMKGIFSQPL